eukprot:maker-scaffold_32-snap-gene-2.63-mRNA-1 protein AED:0.30 eAED:0.30 QI:0/0/0/1/1/1/2/0/335
MEKRYNSERLSCEKRALIERIKLKKVKDRVKYPRVVTIKDEIVYPKHRSLREYIKMSEKPKHRRVKEVEVKKLLFIKRKKTNFTVESKRFDLEKIRKLKEAAFQRATMELNKQEHLFKMSQKFQKSRFKYSYHRGDLPVCIFHGAKRKLQWKIKLDDLDLQQLLPLFFDGLDLPDEPYCFISFSASLQLVRYRRTTISLLRKVLPKIIWPLKRALHSGKRRVVLKTLEIIQELALKYEVHKDDGKRIYFTIFIQKYFRQLLPFFNTIFLLHKRTNLGDEMDYGQRKKRNIFEMILKTLRILERTGDKNTLGLIKVSVPMYESFTRKASGDGNIFE